MATTVTSTESNVAPQASGQAPARQRNVGLKVVQVQTQAEAAGAQRVSDMVGEGLRARGHAVRTVFLYRKTDAYDDDPNADFILRERPRGALDMARAVLGLIGYMRRIRPDAVISYQHYGNIAGTLAGRIVGARRLVANQSGAPGKRGGMLLAALADKAMGWLGAYHFSVVNSAWTEAQFAHYPAGYRNRLRRIDHGVATPGTAIGRATARASFGLPNDAFLVVTTGRMSHDKNHAVLVEALPSLPDIHLAIAGVGEEREAITARAREHDVTDRLHLLGELPPDDVARLLAAGDLFAFPSRNETFGLSAAEAAIAGLPVVANDIPVLREVLDDAAIYFDATSAADTAAAIRRLMLDSELRTTLATAGRALANRYAPERMCIAYEDLLLAPRR